MPTTVGNLRVVLSAFTGQFTTGMKKASVQVTGFSATTKKMAAGLKSIATSFLGVTAAVTTLTKALMVAENFNRKMNQSLAIMGDVSAETRDKMKAAAGEVARSTVFSNAEAAESFFFLASAGLDAQRSIEALPAVAKFAQAGMFNMAQATDLLTDSQTAMGLSSQDNAENLRNLIRVSDVFVKANQSANTSVQQIAEALTADAGTAAVNMGQSLETTVAVLEAYAIKGKKGAEAGTLFGRATRLLTKAARENGRVFQQFGINVIDKATGEYRNLIDIIGDMERAFKGLTKPQRDVALAQLGFAALAQKSITPLLDMTKVMREFKEGVTDVGGATDEVANKQMTPFQAAWEKLAASGTKFADEFGTPILESLGSVGEALAEVTDLAGGLTKALGGAATAFLPKFRTPGIAGIVASHQAAVGVTEGLAGAGSRIGGRPVPPPSNAERFAAREAARLFVGTQGAINAMNRTRAAAGPALAGMATERRIESRLRQSIAEKVIGPAMLAGFAASNLTGGFAAGKFTPSQFVPQGPAPGAGAPIDALIKGSLAAQQAITSILDEQAFDEEKTQTGLLRDIKTNTIPVAPFSIN